MAENEERLPNSLLVVTLPELCSWWAGHPHSDSACSPLPFPWIDWSHVRNYTPANELLRILREAKRGQKILYFLKLSRSVISDIRVLVTLVVTPVPLGLASQCPFLSVFIFPWVTPERGLVWNSHGTSWKCGVVVLKEWALENLD